MGAEGAEVTGAGGVEIPVGVGLGPEVNFGIVVVGARGEEVSVIDCFEMEGGEEAGGGELFTVGEDVFVESVVPIRVGEEGFEIGRHVGSLGAEAGWAKKILSGRLDS